MSEWLCEVWGKGEGGIDLRNHARMQERSVSTEAFFSNFSPTGRQWHEEGGGTTFFKDERTSQLKKTTFISVTIRQSLLHIVSRCSLPSSKNKTSYNFLTGNVRVALVLKNKEKCLKTFLPNFLKTEKNTNGNFSIFLVLQSFTE